jgi:hypothetical protein
MDRQSHPVRGGFRPFIAVLMAAAFACSLGAWASSGTMEIVRLRIQNEKDNVRIEMPLPAFEYILKHSKDDCHLGTVDGKRLNFKSEDLLKILKGKKVRRHEVKFFSVDEPHNGLTHFFVQVVSRKASRTGEKPTKVVLTAREKGGKEDVRLSLSMDAVDNFTHGCSLFNSGDTDLAPFIKTCLASARDMGPGPILSITSEDGEEVTFSLE